MCKPVEANVTNLNNTIRLTDELERQLMLQAIEEHSARTRCALAAGLRKLAHGIRALVGKASAKDAHSAA